MNNQEVLRILNDVNGDGFNEVVVGNPEVYRAYPTIVFPQRHLALGDAIRSRELNQASLHFTWFHGVNKPHNRGNVLSTGDINGDGFNDLIFETSYTYTSSYNYTTYYASRTQVLYGDETLGGGRQEIDVDSIFGSTGFTAGTGFSDVESGYIGVADIDGDGFDDVLIGKPGYGNKNQGAISITFGDDEVDESHLSTAQIVNQDDPATDWSINPYFGFYIFSLEVLGDINQDGREDFKYHQSSEAGDLIVLGSERSQLDGSVEQLVKRGIAGFEGVNDYPNLIVGSFEDETLQGLGGNDIIQGLAGNDKLIGNEGDDRLIGGEGAERIVGGNGNDSLYGEQANDRLVGNRGNDLMFGGSGHDRLNGGPGRDRLIGGNGVDQLRGGPDRDEFVFQSSQHPADRIIDFDPNEDKILLTQAGFNQSIPLGRLSAGRFTIGSFAQDRNDRIIYNDQTGALLFDEDGSNSGGVVTIAFLTRGLDLTASNFRVF